MLDVLTAIHRRNQRGYQRPTGDDVADEMKADSADAASELSLAVAAGFVRVVGSDGFDEAYALTEAGDAEYARRRNPPLG
jgi:hypothetical protein